MYIYRRKNICFLFGFILFVLRWTDPASCPAPSKKKQKLKKKIARYDVVTINNSTDEYTAR